MEGSRGLGPLHLSFTIRSHDIASDDIDIVKRYGDASDVIEVVFYKFSFSALSSCISSNQ